MIKCDVCGKEMDLDFNFCVGCGAKKCPVCGKFTSDKNRCMHCGYSFSSDNGGNNRGPASGNPGNDNGPRQYNGPGQIGGNGNNGGQGYNGGPGNGQGTASIGDIFKAVGDKLTANRGQAMQAPDYGNISSDGMIMNSDGSPVAILSEGEKVVRNYEVTRFDFLLGLTTFGRGYLTVTNKRVIFHSGDANSLDSTIIESHLDGVGGITVAFGGKWNLWYGLISIAIFAIASYFGRYMSGLKTLLNFAGLISLVFIYRKSMTLKIASSKAIGSAIDVGRGLDFSINALALTNLRGRDVELMRREMGALILDFQQMGDKAFDKWCPKR